MEHYPTTLGELIDGWSGEPGITVVENHRRVVVGGLSFHQAVRLVALVGDAGWHLEVVDASDEIVDPHGLSADLSPFSITIEKPIGVYLRILTLRGLRDHLRDEKRHEVVLVPSISKPVVTYGQLLSHWDESIEFEAIRLDTNPRDLVKESGEPRRVPADLGTWLLRTDASIDLTNKYVCLWADLAASKLLYSIADEVGPDGSFTFKGPPAKRFASPSQLGMRLDAAGHLQLHQIGRWIYGSNEAETRRVLIASEIGRTSFNDDDPLTLLRLSGTSALEGARIAHQMGVEKLSLDTIRALADLRKAVSDEAARLSEATRQLASSVTGAVFTGIGVMAARLSLQLDSAAFDVAVGAIAAVLLMYVAAVCWSGWKFLVLHRSLREKWKQRLYRYLPEAEYKELVTAPAESAESAYLWSAVVGSVTTLIVVGFMLAIAFGSDLTSMLRTLVGQTGA